MCRTSARPVKTKSENLNLFYATIKSIVCLAVLKKKMKMLFPVTTHVKDIHRNIYTRRNFLKMVVRVLWLPPPLKLVAMI
jgi:hypothetical protein